MKIIVLPLALIASVFGNFSLNNVASVRKVHLPITVSIPAPAQDMKFVPAQKAQVKKAIKTASKVKGLRTYSYTFKGQATCEGAPCADAQIVLSVISSHTSQIVNARTDKNGRFTALVKVDSKRNGIVRWEMTGLSNELHKGMTEGHQIPQDESKVRLDVPMNLVSL